MKNLVSWAKLHLFCASQGVVSSLWDGFPCPCAAVDSLGVGWGNKVAIVAHFVAFYVL